MVVGSGGYLSGPAGTYRLHADLEEGTPRHPSDGCRLGANRSLLAAARRRRRAVEANETRDHVAVQLNYRVILSAAKNLAPHLPIGSSWS